MSHESKRGCEVIVDVNAKPAALCFGASNRALMRGSSLSAQMSAAQSDILLLS